MPSYTCTKKRCISQHSTIPLFQLKLVAALTVVFLVFLPFRAPKGKQGFQVCQANQACQDFQE